MAKYASPPVEMGATCTVRFRVLKGEAERHNIRWPRFSREDYYIAPRVGGATPVRGYHGDARCGTTGVNEGENLTLACRNAILNMIDLLQERGFHP